MNDYQLKNIIRYNNISTVSNETLAEHMYFTTMMVVRSRRYLIIDDEDYIRLLEYSVLHDYPELVTGDIPHDLKLKEPRFKELLNPIEEEILKNEFGVELSDFNHLKPLFKLFDLLQVMQYVHYELQLGNRNPEVIHIGEHAQRLARGFFETANDYIVNVSFKRFANACNVNLFKNEEKI